MVGEFYPSPQKIRKRNAISDFDDADADVDD